MVDAFERRVFRDGEDVFVVVDVWLRGEVLAAALPRVADVGLVDAA